MAEPASAWHALQSGDVLQRLRSGPAGLTAAEAEARLSMHGPNVPPLPQVLRLAVPGMADWLLIVPLRHRPRGHRPGGEGVRGEKGQG